MAKMTAKQQAFCDEYLIDLNATQAAIRAGYSKKTAMEQGYQLLQKTSVQEYIADRMAEKEAELIASQDEVLRYFTSVMRGESYSSVLARQEDGSETVIVKPPDEKERLDAAKQLAKRYGLDREEIEKQAKIEKLKAEIARLKGETPDDDKADDGFLEELQREAESVWQEQ